MSRWLGMEQERRLGQEVHYFRPCAVRPYDRTEHCEAPTLPLEITTALSVLTTLGNKSQVESQRHAAAVVSAWVRGEA